MPWTSETILALWDHPEKILEPRHEYLKKYAAGFAEVANLCGVESDVDLALSICNSDVGDDPAKVRKEFVEDLGYTYNMPESVDQVIFVAAFVPTPTPKAPLFFDAFPDHLSAPLAKLRRLRTTERERRGRQLAAAAVRLLGRWRWVQRAPDSILPYIHRRQNETGYTDINAFDRWLRSGGPAPTGTTALNCRDAVLVTAREAGLLTSGQLRAAYDYAEAQARALLKGTLLTMQTTPGKSWGQQDTQTGLRAYVAWLTAIDQRLTRYPEALPVARKYGLIPRAGDVVFVRGNPPDHVCISLGRTWVENKPIDRVASLWHHDGGRFSRQPLDEMGPESQLVFLPCPF